MEANNIAAMREALEEAIDALDTIMSTSCHNLREITASRAYRKCREAISLPRRQCDVGTAEEQERRFRRYCVTEECNRYRCGHGCKAVCIDRCAVAWEQMPYEANESEAK